MYPDDTSLTIASDNVHILEQRMNHDICEIHTWLQANKLSLNVVKTKYMIIASQHKIRYLKHQFQIEVNHQPLKREKGYKYLGIEIDESLTWKDCINRISKKISGRIGGLKRVRYLHPLKPFNIASYRLLVISHICIIRKHCIKLFIFIFIYLYLKIVHGSLEEYLSMK